MGKKKILIVEDEADMRTILTIELEGSGYQVFQAEDGEEGLKVAQEVKPDLIISDMMMPKMDGNQLMTALRESDFGKEIPLIILTARAQMKDYFEVMEVDSFVAKPFEAVDLLAKVNLALQKQKIMSRRKKKGSKKAKSERDILILDDDILVYSDLRKTLSADGYKVKVVKTVSKCLETSVLMQPDLILIRFLLEGMNGDKLVQIFKGMPRLKNVPILVYGRKVLGSEQEKVSKAGGLGFIESISGKRLLEVVNQVFNV